ncbi:MAG: hypothetical protein IJS88_06295 [Alphaproteobacteria bacterium]|nr:hypothetical protein [Alphaproteobacteria bacterium]
MPTIRNIFLLYEKSLEPLGPHIKDAVEEMMDCFPEHKNDYPITMLGNWRSNKYAYEDRFGNRILRPYESVDWYIDKAKAKAIEEGRWYSRRQISIDQLCKDITEDPYRSQIPQWSVLITKHDLYGTYTNQYGLKQKLNFCLGVSHENQFSIISTARFLDANSRLDVEGFKTVIMHEFGHLIGLTYEGRANSNEQLGSHCTNDGCIMQQRMNGDYSELTRLRLAAKRLYKLPPICDDCIDAGNRFFSRQRMAYNLTHGLNIRNDWQR